MLTCATTSVAWDVLRQWGSTWFRLSILRSGEVSLANFLPRDDHRSSWGFQPVDARRPPAATEWPPRMVMQRQL